MAETITIKLDTITVNLPDTHIIITKENYQNLQQQASQGKYMTLNDVLKLLSVSRPWFLENVLYKPNIRNQIDIDRSKNGFVKYPKNQGGRYYFLASKTKKYFEEHFAEILNL